MPTAIARNTPTAASAAVNRPGKNVPAANPKAQAAADAATPTATGHQNEPAQADSFSVPQ